MKNLTFFLLFTLLYSSFLCKNKNIRKLEDTDTAYEEIDSTYEDSDTHVTDFYLENNENSDTAYANSTLTPPPPPTPKIILLGFGNFLSDQSLISFNVFFKRFYTKIYPLIVYLTIRINTNNTRLRNLEEEVKTVKCLKIGEDNGNDDNLNYNCQLETSLGNITSISADKNVIFAFDDVNNITDIDIPFTPNANKASKNIQNEIEGLKTYIILENSTKSENNLNFSFTILGEANENLQNGTANLFLDSIEDGILKDIPCILNDRGRGDKHYELECKVKDSISGHLNNANVNTSEGQNLIISMKENEDDYISFDIHNNEYDNKQSFRKGLSRGAIVAIIISCSFAIIAVTIIIFLCNRVKPVEPFQKSSLEIYGSSRTIGIKK